jgi:hypothetical protein
MSDKPGGYVGQDFGELSRAAVLESRSFERSRTPQRKLSEYMSAESGISVFKRHTARSSAFCDSDSP